MGDDWKPFASRSNGCGSACYADAANGTACPGSASCASRVGGFRTRASSSPGLTPALPSRTRGRSRMRENHTSGAVQGVPGNRHSYCDIPYHGKTLGSWNLLLYTIKIYYITYYDSRLYIYVDLQGTSRL